MSTINEDRYYDNMAELKYKIEEQLGYEIDTVDIEKREEDCLIAIIKKVNGSVYRIYNWDGTIENIVSEMKELDLWNTLELKMGYMI